MKFAKSFLVGDAAAAPFLQDAHGSIVVVYSATSQGEGYGFEVGGDGSFLSTVIYPDAARVDVRDLIGNRELVTDEERRRYEYLNTRDRFVKQHLKRLRPMAMTLRHSYGPPYEPGVPTSRVMIRGDYDNPGEVVQAGFLSCITGHQDPAPIRLDPFKRWPTRSRRMALAEWIASPENPLTARVMVNRLWHWHFGRGIVATPSDFGQLSGGPSHPELLDWLANQFVEHKWSIKAMHRMMVTSRTYRQSSQATDPQVAAEIDPDNRLLSHFRPRQARSRADPRQRAGGQRAFESRAGRAAHLSAAAGRHRRSRQVQREQVGYPRRSGGTQAKHLYLSATDADDAADAGIRLRSCVTTRGRAAAARSHRCRPWPCTTESLSTKRQGTSPGG